MLSTIWQKERRISLRDIWDDINYEAEAIVVSDINYEPGSLSNSIYEIIDDRTKRRRLLKQSQVKGLYSDLDAIRKHRDVICSDENVTMLVQGLFKAEETPSITPLDRIYLNAYYRRLLRAKMERDHHGKLLVSGHVVTEYTNSVTDASLVSALNLIKITCKFLGITSTTHSESFHEDKLYMPCFWCNISSKFMALFGENRITVIDEDDPLQTNNLEAIMMLEGQKKIRKAQVLMLLNVVFNAWSGSTLVADGNIIKVLPATYVTRLLPKLR